MFFTRNSGKIVDMKILDLFCGDGGAAWGIHLCFPNALIKGVDKIEMKHYPFEFWQANAIDFPLDGYDFIWCSPPCQPYSKTRSLMKNEHLPLIEVMRGRLMASGALYCIETVSNKPLVDPIMLCGEMFGLGTYRHRYFETNFSVEQPVHSKHTSRNQGLGKPALPGEMLTIVGNFSGADAARKAMGIEHFMPKNSVAQAIPPAYSRFICQHIPLPK